MKKGFTLAEILIALSIMGVIAALTIPMLSSNIVKKEVETSFLKVVSMLDNANMLLMNEKDVSNMDDAIGVEVGATGVKEGLAYIKGVSEILNFKSGVNDKTVVYADYNYASNILSFNTDASDLYISDNGSLAMLSMGMDDYSDYYTILVDLNGPSKKPNALGRDLQAFSIDRSTGKVYGFGSKKGGAKPGAWVDNCKSTVSGAETCAGSIMDNGGKITYKW